ncbi:hypothetical protein Tco_1100734 [Tanacetum coccineum]
MGYYPPVWPLRQTTRITTSFDYKMVLHTPCLKHANVHGATPERNKTKDDTTRVILFSSLGCPPRGLPWPSDRILKVARNPRCIKTPHSHHEFAPTRDSDHTSGL